MGRRKSPVKKRQRDKSPSSDSKESRSRSPVSSASRGALRQPPKLRGGLNGEEATEQGMNNHGFNAQLAEKDAYISELEMELERSTTVADQVQKQLTETLKRLRKAEAAQATYRTWLEALTGAATRVVSESTTIQSSRDALKELEQQGDEGREDLDMFIKETKSFLEEQERARLESANKDLARHKSKQIPKVESENEKAPEQAVVSDTVTESQSVFQPGIKFKLNA